MIEEGSVDFWVGVRFLMCLWCFAGVPYVGRANGSVRGIKSVVDLPLYNWRLRLSVGAQAQKLAMARGLNTISN